MSQRGDAKSGRGDRPDGPGAVPAGARQFIQGLSREERMLIVLKRELYEGSWDDMAADLRARLEGRPYIFKLATRIAEDLRRIERLRDFERTNRVDLSDFVNMES